MSISTDADQYGNDVLAWSSEPFIHEEEEEDLVLDCGNPDRIMVGYHFPSECHTAEDLQQYYEQEGIPEKGPEGFDIPQDVAKCPECSAQLHVEFNEWETESGKPTYEGMDLCCTEEDEEEYPESAHRHWQGEWQPVINVVWDYVKERFEG